MVGSNIKYIALIAVVAVVAVIFASVLHAPKTSGTTNAVTSTMQTTIAATTIKSSSSTTSQTTTAQARQGNITGKYLMTFLACTGSACTNPQNHKTYLAQSDDGSNWTLVHGFRPYTGSVPDLVRRGGTLYIYNPGTVTAYNISTGAESSQQNVALRYANGTSTIFVDPSPILSQNGSIVLFYLPGIIGQDPASCPTGQSSCTKSIMSATEVKGSNGTSFVADSGARVKIPLGAPGSSPTVSDPAIFQDPLGYVLYVSSGQSVLAYSSRQLQGNYTAISGLQDASLVQQGTGGVPSGYYSQEGQQYWTYVSYTSPGVTGVIKLAKTSSIDSQIPSSAFATVVSGCDFPTLGCGYSVESPGIYPKTP
ncbi:MAG: hypothetical protein KGH74_04195 [Candidatus Micrarchaeota archaeon]|nr:hypothetical protein [Candidatus Micrarchaeota archaeon]